MSTAKVSIKINFIMNMLLTLSSFIFPLISFPYVSRILAPAGIGRVSFAQSLITYFLLISELGISSYGIKAVAKVRDDREDLSRTAQELLCINTLMSLIAYALLIIITMAVPRLYANAELIMICSISILFNTLGMEWLYKGLEQYTYITWRSLLFRTIAIVLMFAFIHTSEDYVIYAMITVFAASASGILNFINVRKYISLKPFRNLKPARHLKSVCIFFAMSCATTIYTNLDTVMLGFMSNDIEVGYYNAAIRLKLILVAFVTSLGAVLLPRASYYAEHQKKAELERLISAAFNFVIVVSVALTIYCIVYAKDIVLLLSGNEFLPAAVVMQLIMPTVILIALSNVTGIQILVPLGGERFVLYSELVGAVTDVILNALLIPKLGAAGAAIGTVIAEISVLAVQTWFLTLYHKEYLSSLKSISYGKIIIALIAALAASLWCIRLNIHVFAVLIISACMYFGIYGLVLLGLKERFAAATARQLYDSVRSLTKRKFDK